MRTIKQRGLELVKHFESLYLKAYKCPGGAWTIGWGHTGLKHNDGTVHPGRVVTESEAENLLRHDMESFAERVENLITVALDDDQFDALVSFDFNTGGLAKSTLRKKLNAGDYEGAADEFLKWNKAGGKVLRGLTRRRKSERNLFLGVEDYIIPA
jgi:lysozyme